MELIRPIATTACYRYDRPHGADNSGAEPKASEEIRLEISRETTSEWSATATRGSSSGSSSTC